MWLGGWTGSSLPSDPFDVESLNESQKNTFDQIKTTFSTNGLTDPDLLRFLVARNFDLAKTTTMIEAYIPWRSEMLPVSKSSIENELKVGKCSYLGKSKEGFGIVYWDASLHDPNDRDVDEVIRCVVWWVEYAISQSDHHQIIVVLDRSNMTRSQIDMELFTTLSSTLSNNYPERLNKVLIYPLNWLFRSMWNVVQFMIDQKTRQKVCIFFLLNQSSTKY